MSESESFVCRQCGEVHEGLPTDWGFQQPDEVHALGYVEEYLRARSNRDFCTLDEARYFIRGVLMLPILELGDTFGWGIWVEVSRDHHDLYVRLFNEDASAEPRVVGQIANSIPGYEETLELSIEVQFGTPDQRPTFWLPSGTQHQLHDEQLNGLSSERHHDLLEACGYFTKKRN